MLYYSHPDRTTFLQAFVVRCVLAHGFVFFSFFPRKGILIQCVIPFPSRSMVAKVVLDRTLDIITAYLS